MNASAFRTVRESPIKFTTEAPGLRSGTMDPSERARQEDAMSVVLAQPHRRGNPSKLAGDPLAEFCARTWPNDPDWANDMRRAGEQFGQICRQWRNAKELNVIGTSPGEGDGMMLTEDQKSAMRQTAERNYNDAIYVLRGVEIWCASRMEDMCYHMLEPSARSCGILKNGLYRLARHFGILRPSEYGGHA